MSELEDKLGAILSNQDAMRQIMSLAQSLGGGTPPAVDPAGQPAPPPAGEDAPAQPYPQPAAPPSGGAQAQSSGGDLFSALGKVDPRLITMAMRLAGEYNSNDDRRAALLNALRPFVKPERYAKLDKAIQISKLTRVIRIALDSFAHKGEENGHV